VAAQPIAIIGAGIGGLSAALALARAGFQPRVYEQAPELGEVGAGISLSPNAVKALRFLDLERAAEPLADEPPQQITRHYQSGEVLVRIDRSDTTQRYGAPYWQMHRADLHGLLVAALSELDPESIILSKQFRALELNSDGATVEFADGSVVDTKVVIGADGLKSQIRNQVFRQDDPAFSGFVAWRGLIPAAALADVALAPGSCVFAGPSRIFVRYPVRHGALQNFVAFVRTERWEAESWSQAGDVDELKQHFSEFAPEVQQLLAAVPGGRCHKWGLFARDPLPSWVCGRVTVLGDAAHPMMPWFGQGAASAMEDGIVLARAMSIAENYDEALNRYEAARLHRVTLMHRESLLGGERLSGQQTSALKDKPVRTEDSLGITEYDPATAPV
jgi:salicylate hydroxylase